MYFVYKNYNASVLGILGGVSSSNIIMERVVEAYVGEYASGKSEVAINRALELKEQSWEVTLVDLDTVEPFYTLRPLKALLEKKGITVVGWEAKETFGLGETGGLIKPAVRWVLKRSGCIIMDIGYGVHGAHTLNLVEGAYEDPHLKVLAVVNIARPMTATVGDIIDYVKHLGRVDGLVSNNHLGNDTTAEFVEQGHRVVLKAAESLGIPVVCATVDERLREEVAKIDFAGVPVRYIKRYMPGAIW
ncbi:MAG TPA: hypothetical protein GXX39_04170 [Syntrophothermus lipocalidus]|nr:hypothetical protein [Syntrophothermus lipocalidus]